MIINLNVIILIIYYLLNSKFFNFFINNYNNSRYFFKYILYFRKIQSEQGLYQDRKTHYF